MKRFGSGCAQLLLKFLHVTSLAASKGGWERNLVSRSELLQEILAKTWNQVHLRRKKDHKGQANARSKEREKKRAAWRRVNTAKQSNLH
jgi:hypothetical protein